MRRAHLLIAVSLAANAALALVLWPRIASTCAHAHSASSDKHRSSNISTPLTETERWQKLTSITDDTTYVAQLRAEGFPPEVIRALVRNRLYVRYGPRLLALRKKTPRPPYWQTAQLGYTRYNPDAGPAILAEQRAIFVEIEDSLKALLGADAERTSPYQQERHARTYGSLPSSKISAIEAINRDYGEMGMQLRAETKGVPLAADRERLAFLERERRTDIVRALTPEELDEYDRRNSPSAVEIRNKFQFFEGTEDDFLALYTLQRDFDGRYGRDNLSGDAKDRRAAALPELAKQFEAALGPERYADYQIMTDGNFHATRSTLDQIGLPPEKAKDLVRIQRDANKRAQAIRDDGSLTADQRAAQLAALHKESSDKVAVELGSAENLAAYKRWPGQWLAKLNPPANPAIR
jgi:hypothetical protein